MFPGGTFPVSLYALVKWLDPEFLAEPLQFLSDKAKAENRVRHLDSLSLWISFESSGRTSGLPQGGSKALGFAKVS